MLTEQQHATWITTIRCCGSPMTPTRNTITGKWFARCHRHPFCKSTVGHSEAERAYSDGCDWSYNG